MWTVFWTFLTPPFSLPPLWAILLNNAYVVIWTFGYLPPISCPHGLWMPPYLDSRVHFILPSSVILIRDLDVFF